MKQTILRVAGDRVCEVHQMVLGIREGKEGWFHLYCPGGIACDDDGQLWGVMVRVLAMPCLSFLFVIITSQDSVPSTPCCSLLFVIITS